MDTEERTAFSTAAEHWMVRGGGLDIEIADGKGLKTEEMILNIGPQHPSTHGVLRVVLELDGEVIRRAEPVIGYMHRGAEKLAEYRDARQTLVLMNRHDWLSAFNNELGWVNAVGPLPPETAIAYGCSGPVAQGSGVAVDSRKDEPYEKYGEVDFHVPLGKDGDAYDRLWVLVQRMWQSTNIIEQCMEKLPAGPY